MDIWTVMLGTLPVGGIAVGVAVVVTSLVSRRVDDIVQQLSDTNKLIVETNKRIDGTNERIDKMLDEINRRFD